MKFFDCFIRYVCLSVLLRLALLLEDPEEFSRRAQDFAAFDLDDSCTCCLGSCELDWINDTICDDENNVPECNYDGGDCCQENPPDDWNVTCSQCECKSSSGQRNSFYLFIFTIILFL